VLQGAGQWGAPERVFTSDWRAGVCVCVCVCVCGGGGGGGDSSGGGITCPVEERDKRWTLKGIQRRRGGNKDRGIRGEKWMGMRKTCS